MKNLLLWSCLVFTGCIKEKTTDYTATLYNRTSYNIVILSFKGGMVNTDETIKLGSGDSIKIADGYDRGDIKTPGFTSGFFGGPDDSSVVTYDNEYHVTHYLYEPAQKSSKYYLYSSTRNISNNKSYEFTRKKEKSGSYTNIHKY